MDVNEEEKQAEVHMSELDSHCDTAVNDHIDNDSVDPNDIISNNDKDKNDSQNSCVQQNSPDNTRLFAVNIVLTVLLVVVCIITCCITAIVFSNLRNSPKRAVDSYFPYISASVENKISDSADSDAANDIIDLCFDFDDGVQYKITNVVKENDYASVDVDFTFKDHSAALNDTISYMTDTYNTQFMFQDNFYEIFAEQLESAIANEEETYSTEAVTFTCVKDGKHWVVDYTNLNYSAFYNIFSGHTYDILLKMSEGYYF